MGGFTGWDWSSAAGMPRRRRPWDPIETYLVRATLDMVAAATPEIVDHTRSDLAKQAQHWADKHGYWVKQVGWETEGLMERSMVQITLIAEVTARTDGEWPSIRAAIEEDEADRAAARSAPGRTAAALESTGDAARTVSDRLDALRRSVAVWSARTPAAVRKALSDR